jgi:hypothetical protein
VEAVTYPTLEHVAMQARPYPSHLLEGCKSGLCLFAAAFLGHNDAIHFAEAGIDTMCVDTDRERLREMAALYPDSWSFQAADAWQFAEIWSGGFQWDAVSVDTWTGDLMLRALGSLDLWCSLARKFVTCTITHEIDDLPQIDGWLPWLSPRSGNVDWLVLEATHDR